jgi:hypothetical protein
VRRKWQGRKLKPLNLCRDWKTWYLRRIRCLWEPTKELGSSLCRAACGMRRGSGKWRTTWTSFGGVQAICSQQKWDRELPQAVTSQLDTREDSA